MVIMSDIEYALPSHAL